SVTRVRMGRLTSRRGRRHQPAMIPPAAAGGVSIPAERIFGPAPVEALRRAGENSPTRRPPHSRRTSPMTLHGHALLPAALVAAAVVVGLSPAAPAPAFQVTEDADRISIKGTALEASIRKTGYVSGVEAKSLLDTKTGARDLGFGLD